MSFRYQERGLAILKSPSGLQIFAAERVEGRWEKNFPNILAFIWLLECSYSISAEDGEK